jgi:lipoate-protein ligase B
VEAYWLDLGLIPYVPAFEVQTCLVRARMDGLLPPIVILQENPPIFTIGRSGSRANLLAPPDELARRGIEVLEVNRGGDITYHGPGQVIASPLLNLRDLGMNAHQYLHSLEDVVIELLAGYGLRAEKRQEQAGVWLDGAKIASVGVAVRRWHTFHGLSINVNLDLKPFSLINPCGVERMPVVSLHQVLGRAVPLAEIKGQLRRVLERKYDLAFENVTWPDLQAMLPAGPGDMAS